MAQIKLAMQYTGRWLVFINNIIDQTNGTTRLAKDTTMNSDWFSLCFFFSLYQVNLFNFHHTFTILANYLSHNFSFSSSFLLLLLSSYSSSSFPSFSSSYFFFFLCGNVFVTYLTVQSTLKVTRILINLLFAFLFL